MMSHAAKLMAWHLVIARVLEARSDLGNETGYDHCINVGDGEEEAVHDIALVSRNRTGVSAGTRTQWGTKSNCTAMSRTVTEPSGSKAVPRLLSTNSPFR